MKWVYCSFCGNQMYQVEDDAKVIPNVCWNSIGWKY